MIVAGLSATLSVNRQKLTEKSVNFSYKEIRRLIADLALLHILMNSIVKGSGDVLWCSQQLVRCNSSSQSSNVKDNKPEVNL